MALYDYKWKLNYTGNNVFLRQLTARVVMGDGDDLAFRVTDAVFDNFRTSALTVGFEFTDIRRTLVSPEEVVP